ncbi:MAG: glutamate racemase [Chloroflexi bacterium]|nr:glutamate racemase [Chloroflexota bacterium]MCL5075049.1 glutamate racemase [Chloroflexota bacterium]
MINDHPIGLFDSGVGGLSIMREMQRLLPKENLLYFADTAHCPYGSRSPQEIRRLAHVITAFLVAEGAKLIVVACNTASVVALAHLRVNYALPFVGIVPAIKPAASTTQTKRVGVIATDATLQGAAFAELVEKFASNVILFSQSCPGLVELVEEGEVDGARAEQLLRMYLEPLINNDIDTLVLGCTHYSFLRPTIGKILNGLPLTIIDPAEAVARQVYRVLESKGWLNTTNDAPQEVFFTSGDPLSFRRIVEKISGQQPQRVQPVRLIVPEQSIET